MPKRKDDRTGSSTHGKRQKNTIDLGDECDRFSGEDRFSKLPDEVLILILSLLSIREAVGICCLSKRWRDLWKHATCLNVDNVHALHKPKRKKSRKQVEATSSINWVHQVLQLHQGSTLDELKICFSSPDDSENSFTEFTSELDKWFAFAVAKKVQRLVINTKGARCWPDGLQYGYIFPEMPFKNLFGISCIKFLRHLSLTFVYITGELVEHFLSCCPLLEHLCISGSEEVMNLKVSGSSLRLKFLQVSGYRNLLRLEICAPNLVSFIYEGAGRYKGGIVLKHVPSLVNLSMSELNDYPDQGFELVRSYFPQLLTLNLHLNLNLRMFMLPEFPDLTRLKELSLSVYARDDRSLLDLTPLVERSPSLHKFTFKLNWRPSTICRRKIRKPRVCRHQCLKVVKFSGFVASVIDTELAMYFIKNAIMLEKFIIECSTKLDYATTKEKMRARRDCALKIGNKLPPGVQFIVM